MHTVECSGEITKVVVHARGAVVTRLVTLPEPVNGEAYCTLEPISDLFREGSVRVRLTEGAGQIVAVKSRIVRPRPDAREGESVQRQWELFHSLQDLQRQINVLRRRHRALTDLRPGPGKTKHLKKTGPRATVQGAITLLNTTSRQATALATTITELDARYVELQREQDRLQVEAVQSSDEERDGDSRRRQEITVHITGAEDLRTFEVIYTVDDARWWPTYSVYLDSEAQTVRLELEAMIVQRTRSDWKGVELSLSTSELERDARLPRLASLRLGRATPAPPSGYRPPPEDLPRLFAAYDADRRRLLDGPTPTPPSSPAPRAQRPSPSPAAFGAAFDDAPIDVGTTTGSFEAVAKESAAPMEAPTPRPAAAPMPPPAAAPAQKKLARSRSAMTPGGAPPMKRKAQAAPKRAPAEIEPSEGWLNFDRLRLASPLSQDPSHHSTALRGKLYRMRDDLHSPSAPLISGAARPPGLTDPLISRGHFDYRYDGEGRYEIPSDGRLHRVRLSTVEGTARWLWRSVPRIEPTVYREVSLTNPLDAALLEGQARIFVDGEFASLSSLEKVDQGGTIRLGLGVEDRIQVRRNTRFDEEGKGFLKGRRALDHEVQISLRSGLGHPVTIDVLDRLPVTDDEHVDVELLKESLKSKPFDQEELGHPIRGGRRWSVTLSAGATEEIHFTYRIQIRAKDELIGGNRRES